MSPVLLKHDHRKSTGFPTSVTKAMFTWPDSTRSGENTKHSTKQSNLQRMAKPLLFGTDPIRVHLSTNREYGNHQDHMTLTSIPPKPIRKKSELFASSLVLGPREVSEDPSDVLEIDYAATARLRRNEISQLEKEKLKRLKAGDDVRLGTYQDKLISEYDETYPQSFLEDVPSSAQITKLPTLLQNSSSARHLGLERPRELPRSESSSSFVWTKEGAAVVRRKQAASVKSTISLTHYSSMSGDAQWISSHSSHFPKHDSSSTCSRAQTHNQEKLLNWPGLEDSKTPKASNQEAYIAPSPDNYVKRRIVASSASGSAISFKNYSKSENPVESTSSAMLSKWTRKQYREAKPHRMHAAPEAIGKQFENSPSEWSTTHKSEHKNFMADARLRQQESRQVRDKALHTSVSLSELPHTKWVQEILNPKRSCQAAVDGPRETIAHRVKPFKSKQSGLGILKHISHLKNSKEEKWKRREAYESVPPKPAVSCRPAPRSDRFTSRPLWLPNI